MNPLRQSITVPKGEFLSRTDADPVARREAGGRRPSLDVTLESPEADRWIRPRVTFFHPSDPRWARRVLGRSSSIGKQGCAISCLAMVLTFYDREADPGMLDAYLDDNNGYLGNAVRWRKTTQYPAPAHAPPLRYDRCHDAAMWETLARRTADNRPTIARVDYRNDDDLRFNHFVVIVGRRGTDYHMHDPATRRGDAYAFTGNDNILQRTRRKGGYLLTGLDWLDPEPLKRSPKTVA